MEPANSPSEALRQTLDKVADDVSQLVIQEQQAMNRDFIRMSAIVQEAAENLRECFNKMSAQLARQSARLRAKNNGNDQSPDDNILALMSTADEISAHVGKAIRSLQFEDIMQQMISHSRRRAEEIEKLFITLTGHIDGLSADDTGSPERIIAVLESCLTDIHQVEQALGLKSPVKQRSLAQGDVEIF